MAINIEKLIADSLLTLNETKKLEVITIKDILNQSGVSKQTFYNHFLDKNDLIQYIYLNYIIPDYHDYSLSSFKSSLIDSFKNMKKYHKFLKEACLMEGQNCLKEFMYQHCREYDLKWHQELYGQEPMPQALRFATEYHATASSSMTLSWILSDMPVSETEIAQMICLMRGIGMEQLFKDGEYKKNPYE